MGARHPLPYAFAKAHTLLLENDGTSLTLYAFGRRLLVDPGKYAYERDAWRRFFVNRSAHNVVTVDGVTYDKDARTSLTRRRVTPSMVDLTVSTTGNPDGHLVLRGAHGGPNHDAASVTAAAQALGSAGLAPRLLIDCSHGNSAKDYRRQPQVASEIAAQVAAGSPHIAGVLLESHLFEGRQEITQGREGLTYGQSVTDGCIGWEQTVQVLDELAGAVQARRRVFGA